MSLEFISLDKIQEIAHHYGYWAVFLGIALENTGIPLPGETITITGGFLAGSGELNYWLVLVSSIAGAVLGDNFGYWIGRLGGWPFLLRVGKVFRIGEKQIESARKEFSQNAAKAVFFGRFVTLLRIFAGPMAGIAQMPYLKFLWCNLGGATVWASIIVTLSYFLGRLVPLPIIIQWVTKFGIAALVLVILALSIPIVWEYSQKKLTAKN
ncbi:MAG: DedA family protein [Xenococcaceae cyanobacterium]